MLRVDGQLITLDKLFIFWRNYGMKAERPLSQILAFCRRVETEDIYYLAGYISGMPIDSSSKPEEITEVYDKAFAKFEKQHPGLNQKLRDSHAHMKSFLGRTAGTDAKVGVYNFWMGGLKIAHGEWIEVEGEPIHSA